MLLTRTLRRKMVLGVALILLMLSFLSLSALSGLWSYSDLIDDLLFSTNEAPRRSDLVDAIGSLFEPLLLYEFQVENETAAQHQKEHFSRQFLLARERIDAFTRKLENLPRTEAAQRRRQISSDFLDDLNSGLTELDSLQESLGDPAKRKKTARKMLGIVGELQVKALGVPDHQEGLRDTLREADRVFHSRRRGVYWTSALVVVMFLGLMRYGYVGVFAPLRKLHQGASRVAQGDFDYRLEMPSQDEMAELAESFNRMTARFQETARDLDRQVRERSNQLVRSERLAGIGFLAAGVAHEINNPLSAIAMAAESLEGRHEELNGNEQPEDDEVTREYLGMIQREAFRCQTITAKLLDFARGQEAPRSRCDLTDIISEVISMVRLMSKYEDRNIAFNPSGSCHVEVNGPEIKQVVLNLVANALDSMDSGGTLHIEISEQTDQVAMTFLDEGCGMTSEVVEHLFEPFFTKQKGGKGTGLGMSISQRIIADHAGTIEASSDGPGCGSTFIVRLPRQAQRPDLAA